jgi:hypothetical protein
MQVPDQVVILAESGPLADHLDEFISAGLPASVAASLPLVMTLMVERHRGKASPWAQYLHFLDTEPDLPSICWSVSDRQSSQTFRAKRLLSDRHIVRICLTLTCYAPHCLQKRIHSDIPALLTE